MIEDTKFRIFNHDLSRGTLRTHIPIEFNTEIDAREWLRDTKAVGSFVVIPVVTLKHDLNQS